jgi:hypothetical protein
MENEDRTRFYYWLVAPFWTVPLLRISMNVPEKYKRNLLLYKEFLRALDTRSLDFVYANTGFKLNSLSSKLYGNIKGIARSQKWLYHHTRKLVLKDNYRKVKYPFLDDYIEKIMQSSELIKEAFDIKLLNNMLDKDINKLQYFLLYTLLFRCSLIENDYNYI